MAITISFRAVTDQFMTGTEKVKGRLKSVRKDVNDNAKDWAKWAVGVGAAATAATAALIKTSSSMGAELQKQARVANATTDEFQKMAHGARQFGVDADGLSEILRDMNDRVGDFVQTGGGPMADFFEKVAPKVGVTAEQFAKLSGPASLQLYVESLHKANLNQKDMTFFMEALSGKATELLPLFRDGGTLLNKYAAEAENMGLILDGFELSQLKEMDARFKNMEKSFEFIRARIAAQLIPWLQALMNTFVEVSGSSADWGNLTGRVVQGIIKGVGFLADAFAGLKRIIPLIAVVSAGAFAALANVVDASIKLMDQFLDFGLFVPKTIIFAINKVRAFLGKDPFKIPSIADTEFGKSVGKFAENAADAFEDAKRRAHEAWMEPLPSESIKEWADRVEAETIRARKAFEAAERTMKGEGEDQAVSQLSDDEKEKLRQQKVLQDLEEQQKKSHLEVVQDMVDKQYSWEKAAAFEQGRFALGELSKHNKKMFKVNKVAGIAEALISTYKGIAKALELPFPLNMAAAAATAAMGFAQVQSIRAQQYNGGGGGGVAQAGGGGAAAATGASGVSAQQAPTFNATIERTGEGSFLSESAMETIFENLNDRIRDGHQLGSIGFSN